MASLEAQNSSLACETSMSRFLLLCVVLFLPACLGVASEGPETDDDDDDTGTPCPEVTVYADEDGDGYGDPETESAACEVEPGFTTDGSDCDDSDAAVFPGNPEVCDAKDTDCDGSISETVVPGDHPTLQDAIDAGESAICLAPGVHTGLTDFGGASNVLVEGAGGSASVALDGESLGVVLTLESAESNITLQGITVRGGRAPANVDEWEQGGGLFAEGVTDLRLEDVVFEANTCEGECLGVAFAVARSSDVTLTDVMAREHVADGVDVVIHSLIGASEVEGLTLEGVSVIDNQVLPDLGRGGYWTSVAMWGTGAGSLEVTDLRVANNVAESGYQNAHVLVVGWSSVKLAGVSIRGNRFTGDQGYSLITTIDNGEIEADRLDLVDNTRTTTASLGTGALVFQETSGSLSVANSLIAGNTFVTNHNLTVGLVGDLSTGGGSQWTNVTIHGNSSTTEPGRQLGAGFTCDDSVVELVNVSLTGNIVTDGTDQRGGWGGNGDGASTCTFDASYTNTWGNDSDFPEFASWIGSDGNLGVEPGFVTVTGEASTWDLQLGKGSPLRGVGHPSILNPDGSRSDIGAYGGPGGDW